MIPILLQIPVYFTWWYQRNQIYELDDARQRILGKEGKGSSVGWQDPLGKYSNDLVLLFTPIVLVGLAWVLFGSGLSNSEYKYKFNLLLVLALLSFLVSTVYWIINHNRCRQSKANQANSADAKNPRTAD